MKLNQKGYLLINLAVGLGIIALIVALSLPHIRRYQINSKLSAEARDMAGYLRHAQQLSVTEQTVHGVEFSTSSDTYWIKRYGGATSTIKEIPLDSSVNIAHISGLVDAGVKFNFYGGVDHSGEVVLDNINTTSTVVIKPSGYVKIK